MRILTLWQPWASLIAMRLKTYETRSWGTEYRGPLLIHAAKRPMQYSDMATWIEAVILAEEAEKFDDQSIVPLVSELPYGAVVAIATLADCRMMQCHNGLGDINSHYPSDLELAVGDWQHGRFAWELRDVRPLAEPIPWKGGQGLRNVTADLHALVYAQMGAIA